MKDSAYVLGCLVFCGGAAEALLAARIIPESAILALIFLGAAIYLTFTSKNPLTCLLILSAATTLILSLRFSSLTWGDPWQDYESVIEILVQGSTALGGYRLQQPVLPVLISSLSLVTTLSPLLLQKMAIPLVSALSAPILFTFSRNYVGERTALVGAVLFLVGMPYLHWASQGVRETIGIPFFLFALFFSLQLIRDGKKRDIIITIIAIIGLILAHHQSALLFLIILTAFVLIQIYFTTGTEHIRGLAIRAIFIIGFTLAGILLWWYIRIPFIYQSLMITLNQALFLRPSNSVLPLIIVALIGTFLLILPVLLPDRITAMRRRVPYILSLINRILNPVQIILIGGICLFGLLTLLGRSPVLTSYSPLTIFPLLIVFILAIIGVGEFLKSYRIIFLIWAILPGTMLVGGIFISSFLYSSANIQIDPFRFLGYLWPAVVVMAGSTITRIKNPTIVSGATTILCILLLLSTFPPIVFQGTSSDDRSLVISHPPGELMAITWFKEQNISGILSSDRYGMAPARWLNPLGYQVVEPQGRPGVWNGTAYWLITDRMKQYANFDEWIMRTPHPLDQNELKKIDTMMDREYDNGVAAVYRV